MTDAIKIPLSKVGSADTFAAILEAHRVALADHRTGEPGQPAPIAHEFLDSMILRIPDSGPVESRGPDRFEIAPYEIVDDTPPPPTLADRKQALLNTLGRAAQDAIDKHLSRARVRLLNLDYADAAAKPKNKRTAGEKETAKQFEALTARRAAVDRIVARAAVAIDELTETDINNWTVPTFD